jgi:hypothetical protein
MTKEFECTVKTGHFGAGRSGEKVVRVRANNVLHAMQIVRNLPGVKKGRSSLFGRSILEIRSLN